MMATPVPSCRNLPCGRVCGHVGPDLCVLLVYVVRTYPTANGAAAAREVSVLRPVELPVKFVCENSPGGRVCVLRGHDVGLLR